MTHRIKATIRYDGTDFAGWQVQPRERTVQGVLQDALTQIAGGQPAQVIGAGRTDAGVHALGQVFACDMPDAITPEKLRRAASKMLSPEVRIVSAEIADPDFHPIRDATAKRYAYAMTQDPEPDPFLARYAWTIPAEVDRRVVHDLAQRLVGTHDFAGYCSSGSSVDTTVRTVREIAVLDGPVVGPLDAATAWRIEFTGDGFLYKMVRNLTGTLIDIARGHLPESTLDDRLHAPMPYHGFTAPANGLFLVEVRYPVQKVPHQIS